MSAGWGASAVSSPAIHEMPVRRVTSHPTPAAAFTMNSAAAGEPVASDERQDRRCALGDGECMKKRVSVV